MQAFAVLFPAATTYVTPSAMEFVTALLTALLKPPPMLMFATAGCPAAWLPVTQSTPAITCDHVPLPWQSSTRTATSETLFATPYVALPTVPATCVPWPSQSLASVSLSMKSYPLEARPPKFVCVRRTPVSMMYAFTPAPVALYAYALSSGRFRWSIRSRPQVAGV